MQKKHIYLIIVFIVFLLIFFWFLKPVFIELYCTNQVKKIVGGQWGKLYGAEGYEKKYVNQITWGFLEQLKCENTFR